MWLLLALLACPRPVPPHLQLDPVEDKAQEGPVTSLSQAIERTLAGDPLARRVELVPVAQLASLDQAEAMGAWHQAVMAVEQRGAALPGTMRRMEAQWRGTPVVALSRGYRLQVVQRSLAVEERPSPSTQELVLGFLTPLVSPEGTQLSGSPLGWMSEPAQLKGQVLSRADQWVLAGWLDGPEIPLEPVATALDAPQYDSLRDTPMGRLVQARARGEGSAAEGSWEHLERATLLALTQAAADRDREQADWAELRDVEQQALGVQSDPIAAHLQAAFEGMLPAAASDREAGGALLAAHALRWCQGPARAGLLDRVDGLSAAGRWDPELRPLSLVWRSIALKRALDGMDAGRDTVLYQRALVDLVEALVGTGAGGFETPLLVRPADERAWLALGRAVGAEATTDWVRARVALGAHLEREATAALEATDDPEVRALLERVARRATR